MLTEVLYELKTALANNDDLLRDLDVRDKESQELYSKLQKTSMHLRDGIRLIEDSE